MNLFDLEPTSIAVMEEAVDDFCKGMVKNSVEALRLLSCFDEASASVASFIAHKMTTYPGDDPTGEFRVKFMMVATARMAARIAMLEANGKN